MILFLAIGKNICTTGKCGGVGKSAGVNTPLAPLKRGRGVGVGVLLIINC